ncbi:MAG: hypothetical protein AB4080_13795 [Trichodesmium sp.]
MSPCPVYPTPNNQFFQQTLTRVCAQKQSVARVGSVGSWFVWGDREHQRNNCSEIFLPLVCLKS